jgi:hypothetical protein
VRGACHRETQTRRDPNWHGRSQVAVTHELFSDPHVGDLDHRQVVVQHGRVLPLGDTPERVVDFVSLTGARSLGSLVLIEMEGWGEGEVVAEGAATKRHGIVFPRCRS